MELSFLLANQIIGLFIILIIGYILVKKEILKLSDTRTLSIIALYVVSPCSIINAYLIDFDTQVLQGLLLAIVAAICVQCIFQFFAFLCRKYFGFDQIEQASIIYSNAGNLIIPLVSALLGSEWVIYTSGYIMIQTVFMWTHGKNLVCGQRGFDIKKIFSNINVIAICIGLVLFISRIPMPDIIKDTTGSLGSMIGPLAMIVIGMSLGNIKFKEIFVNKRNFLIVFIRLIVLPMLIILFIKLSGITVIYPFSKQILLITILASSAPVAATISQFAQIYDRFPKKTSTINVLSVIFCVITMPIIVLLYQLIV